MAGPARIYRRGMEARAVGQRGARFPYREEPVVHLLNGAAQKRAYGEKINARQMLALAWVRARYPEAKHAVRLADLSRRLVDKLPPNIVRMFWS